MSEEQVKRAGGFFAAKANCAQSVYAGLIADGKLSDEERMALALAFGGGVAGQGGICGALTGALLAMGEKRGPAVAAAKDPQAARQEFYAEVRKLTEEFRRRHGAIHCRELTGCAMDTPEGRKSYQERGLHESFCTRLVSFSVATASSYLDEKKQVGNDAGK